MKNKTFNRRQFTHQLAGMTTVVAVESTSPGFFFTPDSNDIEWTNARNIGVEGKGWHDTEKYYDRLPRKAENVVRKPVWDLSRQPAGMSVRFMTDSNNIYVRYSLLNENLSMPHMPATGVSGLDLYAQDAKGIDRWVSAVKPDKQNIETSIAENLRPGKRRYTLYLPLYNVLGSLEIGVDKGSVFEGLSPRRDKPVLFYGTSIMQGACASRPGMAIPAILGRRIEKPTINLGFSGNGRMEAEVADLLAEQDPCAYAIDCLPNMNYKTVSKRTVPLVKRLRATHDKTPILLVEDRSYTNSYFFPARIIHHQKNREALRNAFLELQAEGIQELYYLHGNELLGSDGEAATDGSHPNDLGMVRYADAYEPILRTMLNRY